MSTNTAFIPYLALIADDPSRLAARMYGRRVHTWKRASAAGGRRRVAVPPQPAGSIRLSVNQKMVLAERNARHGVDGERTTRAHEREAVICRAEGEA